MQNKSFFGVWGYILIAFIFFILGAFAFSGNKEIKLSNSNIKAENSDFLQITITPDISDVWTPYPTASLEPAEISSSRHDNPANPKYTILEMGKITADKTTAQTGETVNFSATVKNTGSAKKFLTHLCFNYTGGNFGCVRNINIEAGDSFNVNNSMMFPEIGVQKVWLTWSQDHTNFYRPSQASSATVTVY